MWIESLIHSICWTIYTVTPLAGVWIESNSETKHVQLYFVTPLAGVWIESELIYVPARLPKSLPLRECGLKGLRMPQLNFAT